MRTFWKIGLLVLTLLSLGTSWAQAGIPHAIRYQGTVTDKAGVPLEGPYALVFRIYDVETGGTPLWTETQANIPISKGSFSVFLGSVTPLGLAFDKDYWLSVQVANDPEMTPRIRLTSVPTAYRAETAERLSSSLTEANVTYDPAAGHSHDGMDSRPVPAVMVLTNTSGSARGAGEVVVQDQANNTAFTITTVSGDNRQVYGVHNAVAAGAAGPVIRAGRATLQVSGAVTRGNYLKTSSTAGQAVDAGPDPVPGVFAKALTGSSAAGTVEADLFGITLRIPKGGWTNLKVFDSSGTWIRPANVDKVYVEVWGGGGGAGGGTSCDRGIGGSGGGGGGGGGYGADLVPITADVVVTVGAGGAAGNSGENSSFGSTIVASGGRTGYDAVVSGAGGVGGEGGASNATVSISGGAGGHGSAGFLRSNEGGPGASGGMGGISGSGSPGGAGGLGANNVAGEKAKDGGAGATGIRPGGGGGGGGGAGGRADRQSGGFGGGGGAGAPGRVIVYWSEQPK